ncbi:repressor LexA [Candidatus Kuenenbacteria bacterium CG_4_10_14_3_um_filter_39_14]|uniref:Repressor LexA n=1 Tax=Candidatus Kuenenbacteria bacterium CG_4_10_14_3_um_filter_39_14 TaxID=1974614 RepID=A0A2M7MFX3_9BACT|nr:MAG: repressor LexA [Candidatus Kuenenbacteria bacterium CG_4_10_14_3_um_filter_39_14]
MEQKLTQKQKIVLELIYNTIKSEGFPPSLVDLKKELGVSSNQAVLNFLRILEKKGFIKRKEGQARSIQILPMGFKVLGKKQLLPLVGDTSAGPFTESFGDFRKFQEIPSNAMLNERVLTSDEVFLLQVHGDSMINANIDDGDVLLIQKIREFKNGDIVVARSDEGTTVKRFVVDGGKTYLKPENPAYKIIPIYPETYFDGKVILNLSALKNNKF